MQVWSLEGMERKWKPIPAFLSGKSHGQRSLAGYSPQGCNPFPKKEMETHSSILIWEIPWTEEPGRLQSTGLQQYRTRLSNWTEQEGSLFSRLFPALTVCRFFDDGHSDWCEVIPHCSFSDHLKFICLIFGCAALGCGTQACSSSGEWGLLWLQWTGFSLWWRLLLQRMGSRAQAQSLWLMGSVALQHMGSSWSRDWSCVPSISGQILNQWITREVCLATLLPSILPPAHPHPPGLYCNPLFSGRSSPVLIN